MISPRPVSPFQPSIPEIAFALAATNGGVTNALPPAMPTSGTAG